MGGDGALGGDGREGCFLGGREDRHRRVGIEVHVAPTHALQHLPQEPLILLEERVKGLRRQFAGETHHAPALAHEDRDGSGRQLGHWNSHGRT